MQYQTHIAECITIFDHLFLLPQLFEVAQKNLVLGDAFGSGNTTDA